MLPRTVFKALGSPPTSTSVAKACSLCSCSCGSLFQNNGLSHTQKRWKPAGRGRAAPATWKKKQRLEGFALSPEQIRSKQQREYDDGMWLWSTVNNWRQVRFADISPDIATDFMSRFAALASESPRQNHVEPEKYVRLREEMCLEDLEVFLLTRLLMHNRKEENKRLGKRLLFTLSQHGYEEATLKILMHAILAEKTLKGTLRSSEIVYARGHLREIARSGRSYRAMVLEGKIAYALGDQEYAIQMWTQAMEPAVAAAEADKESKTPRSSQANPGLEAKDIVGLSSPWIELTLVHYERYGALVQRLEFTLAKAEKDKARAAIDIGCAQDDPTSHFHAAAMLAETNADGQIIHTSSWLYNMTKAAASGHAKAAHSLAEFYAESGWKYIEDEPPDHVKPTPFDSYPAQSFNPITGWWTKVLQLFGIISTPQEKSSDDLFHTAIFPSTPHDRWVLAKQWLTRGCATTYAPSYLYAARINLQSTLWGQAQAPIAALQLTPARFTYASKTDYEAGTPIDSAPKPELPDILNGESREEAMKFLRAVLHAVEAHRLRDQILSRVRRSNRHSTVDEDDIDASMLPEGVPSHIRIWLYHEDIREQYEHEIWDLEKQAKQVCDEHGIDVFDYDGGLMYKSR